MSNFTRRLVVLFVGLLSACPDSSHPSQRGASDAGLDASVSPDGGGDQSVLIDAGARSLALEDGPRWVFHGSGPFEKDEADGIAVDAFGNVYAAGIFGETVQMGDQTLTSHGDGDVFAIKITPDGSLAWLRQFGDTGVDNAFDAATDSNGNLILNGWFSGTVDFGEFTLDSAGSTDQFVAKLNPEGEVLWARRMGSGLPDGGNELTIDSQDNVLLSAISVGAFDVQGTRFENLGDRDSYVIKLDPDGELIWVRGFGGPGNDRIRAIAVDGLDDVIAGFEFRGEIWIDGNTSVESRGGWDGLAVRLDGASGDTLWHWHLGGPGYENVRAVGGDGAGNAYMHGIFENEVRWGDRQLISDGERDTWIGSLDVASAERWLVTLQGPEDLGGGEMITMHDGTSYVSLDAKGTVDLNATDGTTEFDAQGAVSQALVLGLDPQGALTSSWMPEAADFTFGNTLDISDDGRHLAVDVLVRESVTIDGETYETTGFDDKDFLVVYFSVDP